MKKDTVLGLFILILGILFLFLTSRIPVKTFTDDPGPRVFPYLGSIILVICGIGIILVQKRSSEGQDSKPFLTKSGWKRAGIMTALFIIYAVGLRIFGFHIATPVMVFFFYRQIAPPGKRFIGRGIIFSLATYGVVYLVFRVLLNSFLPTGIFF